MAWNVRDWFRELTEEPAGDELAAWTDWFVAHGIDPDDVAYSTDNPMWSCWVERRDNPGQRQVVYTANDTDAEDRPIMAERVVDLVTSPLPFPVP